MNGSLDSASEASPCRGSTPGNRLGDPAVPTEETL